MALPSPIRRPITWSLSAKPIKTCSAVMLREHFRCVPSIIQFSNQLCYSGEVRPLREVMRGRTTLIIAHRPATIALALPVSVGALTLSQDAYERQVPFMAADQLFVVSELWRDWLARAVLECRSPAQ